VIDMRWEVTGIPKGESGLFKIEHYDTIDGEASWLNYANYRNIPDGTYTILFRRFGAVSWLNIMQDTEQEYNEHDWLMSRMSGDILLAGLGIGMIHIPLLESDDVTSVTIVEKEQDVIDLVWEHCAKDDRFTLIHDDIDTWTPPEGNQYDVGWFDTWLTHEESIDDYITRIQDKYGSVVTDIGGWEWPD
jgi:hypothetical protein